MGSKYLFVLLFAYLSAGMRKIFSGFEAKIVEYPFLVKIMIETSNTVFHCTGTYVHPYWVLTAAHCIDSLPVRTTIHCCMGGEHAELYSCKQIRFVNKAVSLKYFDVGMLKLERPFPFGSDVQVAKLPSGTIDLKEALKQKCYAAGWGKTEKNVISKRLLATQVELLDVCKDVYKLCVIGSQSGPCKGDSGSPLVCNGTVVGVLSTGSSAVCGDTEVLYTYTRTDVEREFIYDAIDGKFNRSPEIKLKVYVVLMCLILYCSIK